VPEIAAGTARVSAVEEVASDSVPATVEDLPEDLLDPLMGAVEVDLRPLGEVLPDAATSRAGAPGVVLAVPVPAEGLLRSASAREQLAGALGLVGLDVDEVAAAWEPSGKAGDTTTVALKPGEHPARSVLLVGVGDRGAADLRAAGAALGRVCRDRAAVVSTCADGASAAAMAAFVEGCALGGYTPPRWTKTGPVRRDRPVGTLILAGAHDERAVRAAAVRARATAVARHLGATPSNIKSPAWMAVQARAAARRGGVRVRVWSERDLRRDGFGGLLAVGGASATPPRLVQLDYAPPDAATDVRRVVLVGKGITFDSGGLSIKAPDAMLGMKTDMSGAAVVLAVLAACRALSVRVRVTGLLALAENAVGGAAYRPGDVITQYGGRTVEIRNTDAEGRIVLADALAYADRELDPDVLVDVATLTGAARIALARSLAPVFSTDERLQAQLVAAGESSGELLWPCPLVDDYRPALDSEIADLQHVAPELHAGAIVGALFLREFAGRRAWAHLDIAGTGRSETDAGILSRGATGFGARLLLTWLEGQ
jgi:leucyl aminopeptidase